MDQLQFFHHPACSLHDTGWGHPEHQGRLRAVAQAVSMALPELHDIIRSVDGAPLDPSLALLAHTQRHVDHVRATVEQVQDADGLGRLDVDTVVSARSWEAALAGAGCAVDAVTAVLTGQTRTAFAAIRPPGHHAESDRAMGFCLLNNVAIAAATARDRGLAERILIVDWDVHHGNGTQEIFYSEPDVFYLSLHQSPHYPGTGAASERGEGAGLGATRNLPMAPDLDPDVYVEALLEAITEATQSFRPDLMIVSAGFDAAREDPLGGFTLDAEHFAQLTSEAVRRTAGSTGGRTVSVLEGGYNPPELGRNVVAHLKALASAADIESTP
jgi:acetoin utilization deacetylase AcuC-like enzyme